MLYPAKLLQLNVDSELNCRFQNGLVCHLSRLRPRVHREAASFFELLLSNTWILSVIHRVHARQGTLTRRCPYGWLITTFWQVGPAFPAETFLW